MVERYARNGEVAVLYSPGYGAGWSTWNDGLSEFLCLDKRLVEFVLNKDIAGLVDFVEKFCEDNNANVYVGGAEQLKIGWVPQGYEFKITEYDGSESLHVFGHSSNLIA